MEGEKLLSAAFEAGAEVESLFVAAGAAGSRDLGRLCERAMEKGVRVFELAPGVLERVSDTVTPQPVLAVVRMPRASVESLGRASFVVVCVDVRDPGNAGAVVRAADASGADGVVFCEGCVDPYNPKAVRASAGSILNLPVVDGGKPREVLETLGALGFLRLGAVAHGGTPHTVARLSSRLALVLGNESSGLPHEVEDQLDGTVTVPMGGRAESLNVSMAAAVLCFEVARRRSNLQPDERPEGK